MPLGVDLSARHGRCTLAVHLLESDAGRDLAGREAFLERFRALGERTDLSGEVAAWNDLALSMYQATGHLGHAKRTLVHARRAALERIGVAPGDGDYLTTTSVRRVERSQRLALNIEEVELLLERADLATSVRIRLAMGAVTHVAELVKRCILSSYSPKRGDPDVRGNMPLAGSEEIRHALELRGWPGPPVDLPRLRNAWAHGDAWLDADSLRMRDDEMTEPISLSYEEIEAYLRAGMAMWWVHLLDTAHAEAARDEDPTRAARLAV